MDDLVLGTPGRPALASYGSQRRQRRLRKSDWLNLLGLLSDAVA